MSGSSRWSADDSRAGIELAPEPASLSAARTFVSSALSLWNYDDPDQVIVLLTDEMVSNAVRHAGGPIGLDVMIVAGSQVRVEVRDTVPKSTVIPGPGGRGGSGHGLHIVESLARLWGVERNEHYKVVWFELPAVRRRALPSA
jgi:anti-sigma regulatory factor (Ser/Thr protein kinase)